MPQELNVVCCYSCKMYQVNIAKKTRKWQCKICNKKQSLQTIYYNGTGSECREYVMNINASKRISEEEIHLASIAAWGLDCNADSDTMCDCDKISKLNDAEWSRYGSSENEELPRREEDFPSQGNQRNCGKVHGAGKQSRSLPAMGNREERIISSGSKSFPETGKKIPGKWDKYLSDEANVSETKHESENLCCSDEMLEEELKFLTSDEDDFSGSEENIAKTTKRIEIFRYSDTFFNRKSENVSEDKDGEEKNKREWNQETFERVAKTNFPSLESKWQEITDQRVENPLASNLKCSQVDNSSGNSGTSLLDAKPTLFDDFHDLDMTIDF